MIIREMKQADVPAVAAIEKVCFSQPWSEKSFSDSLARIDTLFLVGTDEADIPRAYMGMYLSFDEAEITNVAVAPDYRKCGFAQALITEAKRRVKEQQIERVLLEVRESNVPAISLYEKQGFRDIGIRKGFYEFPTEDARIMICELMNE
jgi:ribosomal-protein-alanine N-acetyltransferase